MKNILKTVIHKMKVKPGLFLAALFTLALPALASAAEFYVDPAVTGTGNGSAAAPWQKLDGSATAAWATINKALATSDVTVYFSARKATSDVDMPSSVRISIARTDTSTNRLTLDGMSKYDTNPASPSWSDYSGPSRFSITTSSYSIEAGFGPSKKNYVTVRGFKCKTTGQSQALYYWGGDHVLFEKNDLSAATSVAFFDYAHRPDPTDTRQNGGCTDITFRNNTIHDSTGEGIYIGGSSDTGLPAHSYVTLQGNNIYNTGINGGQGDCIDMKDGLSNVVVQGNVCANGSGSGADGISSHSPARIINNVIYGMADTGITLNTYWGNGYSGATIRNNLIFKNGGTGISISTSSTSKPISNTVIDHNTIASNTGNGITVASTGGAISGLTVTNNIVSTNKAYGVKISTDITAQTVADNDVYGNTSGNYSSIANQTNNNGNISGDPLYVNAANPAGSDGVFWTPDDGYRITTNSPAFSASSTGGPMGALIPKILKPPVLTLVSD
ncbi:right-handed parallel beta-helix repeat-containing protein [Geotalea sp. SG265]|uniref:right-handed parallel beta-helix repeat-containing protein n=1 Tax=Geotalea sp. SG265 TaxID=2922867 RepID=UPI001FAF6D47|nr:right-handed parallel beta-helix repeat-containing protein [Geotalea sp. SG265]